MYEIHFCGSSGSEYGLYNYKAIGSKAQVIEEARIKSTQVPMLKHKEWNVVFKKDGEFEFCRTIKEAKVI